MPSIEYVGHATVYIELDGTRLLTDPVLRARSAGLVHRRPPPDAVVERNIDAVLVSHLHHDHLDMPSLRRLPPGFKLLIARGGGPLLERSGFPGACELSAGESVRVKTVHIAATRADHRGFRVPAGPTAETIGYVIEGSVRIFFAGDTDVYEEMRALQPIDVALLPIAGWGPRLGEGHMDAVRAVDAMRLLQPRIVIPIHWGTLTPWGMHYRTWAYQTQPALDFAAKAARELPSVEVRVLQPGESVEVVSSH